MMLPSGIKLMKVLARLNDPLWLFCLEMCYYSVKRGREIGVFLNWFVKKI